MRFQCFIFLLKGTICNSQKETLPYTYLTSPFRLSGGGIFSLNDVVVTKSGVSTGRGSIGGGGCGSMFKKR